MIRFLFLYKKNTPFQNHGKINMKMKISSLFFIFFSFFFSLISFHFLPIQTAFVAPIEKDHNSQLYSISVYTKTTLTPTKLHLDLGGAFSWIDCYSHFNSSTYLHVNCNSPLCTSLHSNICGNCYEPLSPTCANDTCFVYPEKPSLRDSIDDYNHPKLTDSENMITDVLALHTSDGSILGPLRLIPDFPFSCVKTSFLGEIAKNVVGLAALGRSNESIPSVVSAKFNAPNYFAVCLSGSRSNPGVAFFGSKGPYRFSPNNIDLSQSLIYTPLVFNNQSGSIYTYWLPSYEFYIGLTGIKVNGKTVPFNTSLLRFEPVHGGGGTKISTSTTYALLQTSIYKAFMTVFIRESATFNLTLTNAVKPFGVCYAASSVTMTTAGPSVPGVDLVIEKGKVVWRMNGRNLMVRIKKNGVDAWCVGLVNGGVHPRTPIVIGGLQMEDQLFQFDLENHRLGFSSSLLLHGTACSNFNFTSVNHLLLNT